MIFSVTFRHKLYWICICSFCYSNISLCKSQLYIYIYVLCTSYIFADSLRCTVSNFFKKWIINTIIKMYFIFSMCDAFVRPLLGSSIFIQPLCITLLCSFSSDFKQRGGSLLLLLQSWACVCVEAAPISCAALDHTVVWIQLHFNVEHCQMHIKLWCNGNCLVFPVWRWW